jgi:hypothetical protein
VYIIWVGIQIILIFFLLLVVRKENKSVGLVIYFFFQSVVSLFLFIVLILGLYNLITFILIAKLGVFPFFYWIVVTRVKVGLLGNMFVLRFQKILVFWLYWLLLDISLVLIYLIVYIRVFFVIVNLLIISDLWLLIVYSSIANTGIIILRVYGTIYFVVVLLYLRIIFFIIFSMKNIDSYIELLLIVFFFIVVPPFILFFMKFYVILRIELIIKLAFFLVIFDVFVLLYYFRLVFIKFMLIDVGVLIYLLNLFLILIILLIRNCVAMIIFY